ncbi:MAG TPA: ribokinase [Armatimonadota bacterium]|nr:ribokinase [Armatimonadota bacterium]
MSRPKILVVGSANMDLVIRTPRMPIGGETLFGSGFSTVRGGKGANQAIACARIGAETWMLGCVGKDAFGTVMIAGLEDDGVNCRHVRRHADAPTGVAMIMIDDAGENSIIVAPGANMKLEPTDIADLTDFGSFDAVLLQLEIPMPVVEATLEAARDGDVLSVLDAGPATNVPPDVLHNADVISPNQTEALTMLGESVDADISPTEVAARLLDAGSRNIVLKRGAEGAIVADMNGQAAVPAHKIDPVDTTGAGDAFTAALAVSLASDASLVEATRFGCAAGALAATIFGAAPSMPTLDAIEQFMKEQGA